MPVRMVDTVSTQYRLKTDDTNGLVGWFFHSLIGDGVEKR